MAKMIRLIYVSRATIDVNSDSSSITPEVEDILVKSRQNNQRSNIGGALYFANGYFFQCLEGKESAVYRLLETIKADSRHADLKISYCKRVRRRCFNQWSMKYVPVTQEVNSLLTKQGYTSFIPTEFTESDINLVIDLFTRIEDSSLKDNRMRDFHRLNISWWKSITQRLAI